MARRTDEDTPLELLVERGTAPGFRLTRDEGESIVGTRRTSGRAPAPGRRPADAAAPVARQRTPAAKRALLLVGRLDEFQPSVLTVSRREFAEGETPSDARQVSIKHIDMRSVSGFGAALSEAIVNLGFAEAGGAELRLVSDNRSLRSEMGSAGVRQIIYVGHGGGEGIGLFPGTLSNPPLTEVEISAALRKDTPAPIFVACWGGTVTLRRGAASVRARGFFKPVRFEAIAVRVSQAGIAKAYRNQRLSAADLHIESIRLNPSGTSLAPNAPLRPHVPNPFGE